MKQGCFAAPSCVVSVVLATTTPSDSLPARCDFPLGRLYASSPPGPQSRGRVGSPQFLRQPSDRSTLSAPRGSWAPAPGSKVPSMAFARPQRARLPFAPLARAEMTTLQGSLHAADLPVALASRFDDGISPSAGDRAIGDPGVSPDETRTRWLTKACRSVSLRSSPPPSFTCPSCLGTLGPIQAVISRLGWGQFKLSDPAAAKRSPGSERCRNRKPPLNHLGPTVMVSGLL